MNEPSDYLLTRNEFLLLVFTLLTAGAISEAHAFRYVYGAERYGGSLYGGGLF